MGKIKRSDVVWDEPTSQSPVRKDEVKWDKPSMPAAVKEEEVVWDEPPTLRTAYGSIQKVGIGEGELSRDVREVIEKEKGEARIVGEERVKKLRGFRSMDALREVYPNDESRAVREYMAQVKEQRELIAVEEGLERKAITTEYMFRGWGPFYWASKTLGNIERLGRGAAGLMLKGQALAGKITGQEAWTKEMQHLVDRLEKPTVREEYVQQEQFRFTGQLIKEGKGVEAAQYALTNATADVAQALYTLSLLPKVSPIPGLAVKSGTTFGPLVKATTLNATRLAGWNFLTTPGNTGERMKSALTTFGYMMTPVLSSPLAGSLLGGTGAGAKALAVSLDMIANTSISTLITQQYPMAYKQAKAIAESKGDMEPGGWQKYVWQTSAPQVALSDFFSTLGTKPTASRTGTPVDRLIDMGSIKVEQAIDAWDKQSQVRDVTGEQWRAEGKQTKFVYGETTPEGKPVVAPGYETATYKVTRPGMEKVIYEATIISTSEVNKIISKFPERVTDQVSLERVGNAIAEDMGMGGLVDWKFLTRKTYGVTGLYRPPREGRAARINISVGKASKGISRSMLESTLKQLKGKYSAVLMKKIETTGDIARIYSTSQGEVKRTIIHELVHNMPGMREQRVRGTMHPRGFYEAIEGARLVHLFERKVTPGVAGVRVEVPQDYINAMNDQIKATMDERGLPPKYLDKLVKQVRGTSKRELTPAELSLILNSVQKARPKVYSRRTPVNEETEKKLDSLIAVLGATDKVGRTEVARIMVEEGIKGPPRFVDKDNFIEQKDAKHLLSVLNDEGEVIKSDISLMRALNKDPDAMNAWREVKGNILQLTQRQMESGKKVKVSAFWDQVYMFMEMEGKTGGAFHRAWVRAANARMDVEAKVTGKGGIMEGLEKIPGFVKVATSIDSQNRVRSYIESFLSGESVKTPPLMTRAEFAVAEYVRGVFKSLEGNVRELRFTESYRGHDGDVDQIAKDIPDASRGDIEKAVDAYEYEGVDALRKHLGTVKWGVIDNGYAPRNVFITTLMRKVPSIERFVDYMLKTRRGIEFDPDVDRSFLQQFETYSRQLLLNQQLSPHIRHIDRLWRLHVNKFEGAKDMEGRLTRTLNEMKGFTERGGWVDRQLRRLLGQVMSGVFFDLRKWARNKLQNYAFYPWRRDLFNPRNRSLTEEEREYFNRRVSQKFGLLKHYMYGGEKPIPIVGKLAQWARRISLYPMTDETNRLKSFSCAINRAERAINNNPGDIKGILKSMRIDFLEPLEQMRAIEVYAEGGPDALKRYFATRVTDKVNFLYERWRRASVEQGVLGRTYMNLFTFPRSYVQRLYTSARKVLGNRKGLHSSRLKSANDLASVMIIGTLIGEGFKLVTGSQWNPYAPWTIPMWRPGGLVQGVPSELAETFQAMIQGIGGDEQARDRAIIGMKRSADLLLPFYEIVIDSIETISGTQNIDLYAMRSIREALDDRYKVAGDRYDVERDFIEAVQHMFFGSTKEEEKKKKEARIF